MITRLESYQNYFTNICINKLFSFTDGRNIIRYSIYSGDPSGLFKIDPVVGMIRTAGNLDHETRSSILLNIQATSGDPPVYGHTQVSTCQ